MSMKNSSGGRNKDSFNNISSTGNINVSKVEMHSFHELPEYFQLLAESKAITILPLKPGSKKPKLRNWKRYQGKPYPISQLKRHSGNFGVISGGNGYFDDHLVILDIDDEKGAEGLFKYFKDIDTLTVKTASKGYHLYFWSAKPITDINYIGKLFNLELELRGKPNIYVVLPPSSIKYEDGFIGSHELLTENTKEAPIMELKDVEEFVKDILINAGYKPNPEIKKQTITETTPTPIPKSGKWERELTEEEISNLIELLKPLYKQPNRQKLILYLSGWLKKAEVTPNSALKVVELLSSEDEEKQQRVTALKNSYRGLNEESLKGQSGIWDIITSYYTKKHSKIKEQDKKLIKIDEDTKNHYRSLAKIIVHPNSVLGVKYWVGIIKNGGKGQTKAIKRIHQFLKARYEIIKDRVSGELAIYNYDTGYYEFYDDNTFQEFLLKVFGDEIFTMEETRKIKSIFARMKNPDDTHIVFDNGILNLETLELEDPTPEYFLTFKVPYRWNPEAKGNYVEEKVKEILVDEEGEEKGILDKFTNYLELVGYVLGEPGNPKQKIFLYVGNPGSGKTQLINLIAGLIKGGTSSVPLQEFKDRFGLQPLLGKRINTLFDISEEEINDPTVIKAVSGGDSITINRKFKEAVTFETGLPVKTIGAGNVLPKIKDEPQAMARRLNITKVNNDFTKRTVEDLAQKLLKDEEGMEWLIHKSITSYHKMKEEEVGFTLDFTPSEMQLEYLKLSDPCRYAMENLYICTNDENDFLSSNELITSINSFLSEKGLRIPKDSKNNHHPAIRQFGGEKTRSRINGDLEWGYTLIKAKNIDKDPKRTRLDRETLISFKPNKEKEIAREGTEEEKNIMDIMSGLTPMNLVGVQLEAKHSYDVDKKEFMDIIKKWREDGVLNIDNSAYYKE